jgi:hypothetical protein
MRIIKMGFFSLKAKCSICGKETGLNRCRLSRAKGWICPHCLKLAGGLRCIDPSNMTVEDIKKQIDNPYQKKSRESFKTKRPESHVAPNAVLPH